MSLPTKFIISALEEAKAKQKSENGQLGYKRAIRCVREELIAGKKEMTLRELYDVKYVGSVYCSKVKNAAIEAGLMEGSITKRRSRSYRSRGTRRAASTEDEDEEEETEEAASVSPPKRARIDVEPTFNAIAGPSSASAPSASAMAAAAAIRREEAATQAAGSNRGEFSRARLTAPARGRVPHAPATSTPPSIGSVPFDYLALGISRAEFEANLNGSVTLGTGAVHAQDYERFIEEEQFLPPRIPSLSPPPAVLAQKPKVRSKKAVEPRLAGTQVPTLPVNREYGAVASTSSTPSTSRLPPPLVLPHLERIPSSAYEVVLVIDHREREFAPSDLNNKSRKKDPVRHVLNKAEERGLGEGKWVAGNLLIGDVAFAARCRDGRMFMLDVIVERKRLDDLVSSLTDGRFKEQKFRLARSKIRNVIYLIEEYEDSLRREGESWWKAIDTVMSSTIVIEKFILKETCDVYETAEYYVDLLKYVTKMYKNKDLYAIPSARINKFDYARLITSLRSAQPSYNHVVEFETFQRVNNKSGNQTVHEVWCKMLLAMRGVSREKASLIANKYQTPKELWEAMCAATAAEAAARREGESAGGNGKGKKKQVKAREMLADLSLKGRQKLGPKLSGDVFDVFMGGDDTW